MSDCIRVCASVSTSRPVTISDLLWEKSQQAQTRFIAAQDAARAFADQVEAVSRAYDFSFDDVSSRIEADGTATQLAMRLTRRACPAETLVVVWKADGEAGLWLVQDMARAHFEASVYIAAVEKKVVARRAARLSGRAR